ncbi:MAG: SpoIIE family protein phosphatase [Spirochaetales bacterium]|nr:SpoIIE family protein phosphatase [Spirochaetales bacterium]
MAKARIMVVEDESIVALQIQEGLVAAGYDVPSPVANGKDAIKQAGETEPDLILMDITLKGEMDGIQTASTIKDMYDIPIIYLTAYSDNETVERAKITEPYGYILKPLSEKSLILAIEMTLQKARKAKEFRQNSEWYSSILKGMGQGLIVVNVKGEIRFINQFAEQLTLWAQHEVAGKRITDVFPVIDSATGAFASFPMDRSIVFKKLTKGENLLLMTKDKVKIPIEYSVAPLQNKMGNVIGIVIIFFGIRKKHDRHRQSDKPARGNVTEPVRLLPRKGIRISGFRSTWYFIPSILTSGVSFNFFSLDENHIGFFMLDVSGYGFTTALFSMNLHQFLSPAPNKGGILVRQPEDGSQSMIRSPGEVARELNNRFFIAEKDNPYFTLVYAITDIKTGSTRLVNAGHPSPIYQGHEGKIKIIQANGSAIGMTAEPVLSEYEFTFEPQSRLFLYSDGLIDSTFADINQICFNRLVAFIENNTKIKIPDLIRNLENEERGWHMKQEYKDDASLFIIERE